MSEPSPATAHTPRGAQGSRGARGPRDTPDQRVDQFLTLAEVSRAVASILDLDTLLSRVVTIIRRQFGYPFVHLYIVDPVRGQIIYRAGSGSRSHRFREVGLTYGLDDSEGIIPWVARNGSTVVATT